MSDRSPVRPKTPISNSKPLSRKKKNMSRREEKKKKPHILISNHGSIHARLLDGLGKVLWQQLAVLVKGVGGSLDASLVKLPTWL